jgi:hypothetical protein
MPDLPYSERIERRPERPGDLGGDRNSSASEADDDGLSEVFGGERSGEPPACIGAISEREEAHARTRQTFLLA